MALAIALLGILVGWLTGASGSNEASGLHPQVVAAVVPVVITASGLVLYYAALKFPEKLSRMAASCGLIIFCITILFGVSGSTYFQRYAAAQDISSVLILQRSILEDCSKQEKNVNRTRELLELPDLPSEYFCGQFK